jgi:hypothetical protein
MRKNISTLLIAALTAAALAGCGLRAGSEDVELDTALGPEGTALAALGYDPEDLAPGDPVATDDPRRWERWHRRHPLRENLLHGEVVVQTDGGTRTVLAQRGEVTDISDTAVTVTSTDGFVQTWTYGEALRVVESRTTIEPQQLSTGAEVGVAGHDQDGTPIANLIVIPAR